MNTKLLICYICARGQHPSYGCSLVGELVSWSCQESRLVNAYGLPEKRILIKTMLWKSLLFKGNTQGNVSASQHTKVNVTVLQRSQALICADSRIWQNCPQDTNLGSKRAAGLLTSWNLEPLIPRAIKDSSVWVVVSCKRLCESTMWNCKSEAILCGEELWFWRR